MSTSTPLTAEHQDWQAARESVASNAEALHYLFDALAHAPKTLLKGDVPQETRAIINAGNSLFAQASTFFSLSRHAPEKIAERIQQQGITASRTSNLTAIASLDEQGAEFIKAELNKVFEQINWEAVPAAITQGKHFDPFTRLRIEAEQNGGLPEHHSLGERYQLLAEKALDNIATLNRYPHVQRVKEALEALTPTQGKGV